MRIAEEMVIEKVKMPSRQPFDFRERRIDRLRIEGTAALEKRFFVTEIAHIRAAARNHDRVGDQIQMPFDEIAANRRQRGKRSLLGSIQLCRMSAFVIP